MNRDNYSKSRSHFSPDDLDEFAAARRARRARNSRWKRPRRILGVWARYTLLAGVIVVSVFIAIGLVAKAVRPYREASAQSAQLAQTQSESDALAAENALLTRRIIYLQTPGGIASEARKMGYLRPGEIPIVVEGQAAQSSQPDGVSDSSPALYAAPGPPEAAPRPGMVRRFWNHLTGY